MLIRRFVRQMCQKWKQTPLQPLVSEKQATDFHKHSTPTETDYNMSEYKDLKHKGNIFSILSIEYLKSIYM